MEVGGLVLKVMKVLHGMIVCGMISKSLMILPRCDYHPWRQCSLYSLKLQLDNGGGSSCPCPLPCETRSSLHQPRSCGQDMWLRDSGTGTCWLSVSDLSLSPAAGVVPGFQVFVERLGVDKEVVDVDKQKPEVKVWHGCLHQTLEGGRCWRQAHRHPCVYEYKPKGVVNAVLCWPRGSMEIWWYPLARSKVEKYWAPTSASRDSWMLGSG